jgi:hypothetical protein
MGTDAARSKRAATDTVEAANVRRGDVTTIWLCGGTSNSDHIRIDLRTQPVFATCARSTDRERRQQRDASGYLDPAPSRPDDV